MKKYRNEWKYEVSDNQIQRIKYNLEHVLEIDEYATNGKSLIRSLYFDDYDDSSMNDNDVGSNHRYKWRIRYYNNDLSYIVLERKEKLNNLGRKEQCELTIEEVEELINGDVNKILWETDKELLKLFLVDILIEGFQPKLIVEYERIAYVEPVSNIRITFDRKICVSKDIDSFIDGEYIRYYIQDKNKHVLEIKFDDILPSYIKQATYLGSLIQSSFSKYYIGRKLLG